MITLRHGAPKQRVHKHSLRERETDGRRGREGENQAVNAAGEISHAKNNALLCFVGSHEEQGRWYCCGVLSFKALPTIKVTEATWISTFLNQKLSQLCLGVISNTYDLWDLQRKTKPCTGLGFCSMHRLVAQTSDSPVKQLSVPPKIDLAGFSYCPQGGRGEYKSFSCQCRSLAPGKSFL